MDVAWLLTLVPIFGLIADVIAQIGVAHILRRPGVSIVAGILSGLVVTCVGTALCMWSLPSMIELVANWAVAILTYVAFAFGYWAFLNLNITSLRIRMLREILQSPGGISREELTARYSADESLNRRLERLELSGQLSCREGRWRLDSRVLLVLSRTMSALRALILPTTARQRREG